VALVVAGGGRRVVVLCLGSNGVLQGVVKGWVCVHCGDGGSRGTMFMGLAPCHENQNVESEGVCAR